MKEREIIELATHNFLEITGAKLNIKLFEYPNTHADAIADLDFENQQQEFSIEVKNEVRSFNVPKLMH